MTTQTQIDKERTSSYSVAGDIVIPFKPSYDWEVELREYAKSFPPGEVKENIATRFVAERFGWNAGCLASALVSFGQWK